MHGKTDQIEHDGRGIVSGLPNPLTATRYHSLVIDPPTLPDTFEVSAWSSTAEGEMEIMGIRHRSLPIVGVQFHPESLLCADVHQLLQNFLEMQAVS